MFRTEILPTSLSATTKIFVGMRKRGFSYHITEDENQLKTSINELWNNFHIKTRDDIAIIITTEPNKSIFFSWRDMSKKIITDITFLKKLTDTQDIILNQE